MRIGASTSASTMLTATPLARSSGFEHGATHARARPPAVGGRRAPVMLVWFCADLSCHLVCGGQLGE
jgi:hypothetical protein